MIQIKKKSYNTDWTNENYTIQIENLCITNIKFIQYKNLCNTSE